MYSSAYHRTSDDSVSSYGGHDTFAAALTEAKENILNPDIDSVWVRDKLTGVVVFEQRRTDEEVSA